MYLQIMGKHQRTSWLINLQIEVLSNCLGEHNISILNPYIYYRYTLSHKILKIHLHNTLSFLFKGILQHRFGFTSAQNS